MNPAIEYVLRTNLIKDWFAIPCSLFLNDSNDYQKIVITIAEEFKPSDFYSVKHWFLEQCSCEQVLPFMNEYRIHKDTIFANPITILSNYKLLNYNQEPIPSCANSFKQPMISSVYEYFYDNFIECDKHKDARLNWLWSQFVKIYVPQVQHAYNYSTIYSGLTHVEEQRQIVCKHMKKQWKIWTIWQQHLLLNAGELVFSNEYANNFTIH